VLDNFEVLDELIGCLHFQLGKFLANVATEDMQSDVIFLRF
jgi:hypothetical protein